MGNPQDGMTAREVDRAASRLEQIRDQRRARLLVAAAAAGLAASALPVSDSLAIALVCGTAVLLVLAVIDTWRWRDLISNLALNEQAYTVPEVRRYGDDLVAPSARRRAAEALDRVVRNAGSPGSYYLAGRVHACRKEIRELAEALRAPDSRFEPTSLAMCWQLLRSGVDSPLYNWHLPAEDLRMAVRRIQAGVRHS
jgi:hypothetical protein